MENVITLDHPAQFLFFSMKELYLLKYYNFQIYPNLSKVMQTKFLKLSYRLMLISSLFIDSKN